METMNANLSYKDKCGNYAVVAAELIVAKQGSTKNDYVRFSLKKVKKNGRIDTLGFSHYFNVGIKDLVDAYKKLGVTEQGISEENLKAWKEDYDKGNVDYECIFYGFWWTQPFGAIYRNKDTGKVSSETLVFIPCDEDTGLPKPEFVMTAARLAEILKGYEPVQQDTAEAGPSENKEDQQDADNEHDAFEEYIKLKKEGKL